MLNQIILVGKFEKIEKNVITMKIEYKNGAGEYVSDKVEVNLAPTIAQNTAKYVHKNDLIGIRGSLYMEDGKTLIRADKVTFLGGAK